VLMTARRQLDSFIKLGPRWKETQPAGLAGLVRVAIAHTSAVSLAETAVKLQCRVLVHRVLVRGGPFRMAFDTPATAVAPPRRQSVGRCEAWRSVRFIACGAAHR
jgi:hypothetical protein